MKKAFFLFIAWLFCGLAVQAADRVMKGRYLFLELPTRVQLKLADCSWSSNDPSVLRITESGMGYCQVQGVSPGSTYVIVRYKLKNDTYPYEDQFFVDVYDDKPTSISFSPSKLDLDVSASGEVRAKVEPSEVSYGNISWASENSSIATVAGSGLSATVTAHSVGRTTITATSSVNGVTGRFTVTSYGNSPTSVSVAGAASLEMFERKQLTAAFQPEFQRSTVSWTSSDPSVAEVDDAGLVTGNKVGSVTITARTANGCVGTKLITVLPPTVKVEYTVPDDDDRETYVTVWPCLHFDQLCSKGSGFDNVKLTDFNGTQIEGEVLIRSGGKSNLAFLPAHALQPYTFYRFDVPKDAVVNEWGGTLQKDYHIVFKTKGLNEMTLTMNKVSGKYIYLQCSQSEALLRYTIDGSEPTLENGTTIAMGTAILISKSCRFRAKAFLDGYETPELNEWITIGPVLSNWFPKGSLYNYNIALPYLEFDKEITLADPNSYLLRPSMRVSSESVLYRYENFTSDFIIDGCRVVFVPRQSMNRSKTYWLNVSAGTLASSSGETNDDIEVQLANTATSGATLERIDLVDEVIVKQTGQQGAVLVKPYPLNAVNTMTWTSSNPSVVSINSNTGVYTTGTSAGKSVVTITSTNGITASCTVYVGMEPEPDYVVYPREGATDFMISDYPSVSINSKEALKLLTNNGKMRLFKGGGSGETVAGTATLVMPALTGTENLYRLEFRPTNDLEPNTPYILTIDASILGRESEGSPIPDLSVSFTTINLPVMTLTASTSQYRVEEGTQLELICSEPDAEIRYTTDGITKPSPTSSLYTGPITITKDISIWAQAYKDGYVVPHFLRRFTAYPANELSQMDVYPYGSDFPYVFKDVNPYVEYHRELLPGENFENCYLVIYTADMDEISGEFIISGKRLVFVPNEPLDGETPYAMFIGESSLTSTDDRHNKELYWLLGSAGTEPQTLMGIKMLDRVMALEVGARSVVLAKPIPLGANYNRWQWTSSNPSVATISERGVVTGVNDGEATVTLTSDYGLTGTTQIYVGAAAVGIGHHAVPSQAADVYTLQGIKVPAAGSGASKLRPGVYISNGRKIIVK